MKWFKFYGQDYISDPKMLSLSPSERSCWITLLAYSSINDNGMITFLSEEQLMFQANISPTMDEWDRTVGILKKLENLEMITVSNGMITVKNWKKRQETSLTSYERVKRYREKKQNDNTMITLEEKRIDKKRIDKDSTPTNKDKIYNGDFESFWKIYPKRVGKGEAWKSWDKLKPNDFLIKKILSSVENYSTTKQWKNDGGRFIPNPATFLNQRRFDDDNGTIKSKYENI